MTVHISGRIEEHQLKLLERIAALEKTDRSSVLRRVIELGAKEYLQGKAVGLYRRGEVSAGRAAEIASISLWEFYDILGKEGVTLRVDLEALEEKVPEGS
ncbi:MAG: UPF0175 family protein [Candidatus Geothermarchaeales archaeon]